MQGTEERASWQWAWGKGWGGGALIAQKQNEGRGEWLVGASTVIVCTCVNHQLYVWTPRARVNRFGSAMCERRMTNLVPHCPTNTLRVKL